MNTQTAIKERPIIMGTESVRAILDGRKTETRRVIKPQPTDGWPQWWHGKSYGNEAHFRRGAMLDYCPYGQPGDRLWVRETWCVLDYDQTLIHKEDCGQEAILATRELGYRWRSPISIPRLSSRILLDITDVRA